MPVMIPPIAPGLKEPEVTMMGCIPVEVSSESGDVDMFEVALRVPEVAVINVDETFTGRKVATIAVDIAIGTEDSFMLDVVADGMLTRLVDPISTSTLSGRYGIQSQVISSHPDLPTCRHDSSQFLRNTASISYTHAPFN